MDAGFSRSAKQSDELRETAVLVRRLMDKSGLTQTEIARRVSTSPSHINHFLNGHLDIRSSLYLKILSEIGFEVSALLTQKWRGSESPEADDENSAMSFNRVEHLFRSLPDVDRRTIVSLIEKLVAQNGSARCKLNLIR